MKRYLNITLNDSDKKDVEKLLKLAQEIKKQQQVIDKAKEKISKIQDNYSINKYDLVNADNSLLKEIDIAMKLLTYGYDYR